MLYCLPPHLHDFHIAIRAFNIELARIADTISHPTVGTMRMQFWREAINSTLSAAPRRGQPVTILLASALETLSARTGNPTPPAIMKSWFNRLIISRENRLTNPPFATLESLETYSESTYSTLLYLTLSALPLQSVTLDHLASHIGKAAGITAILRGFPLIAFPPKPQSHHNNPSNSPLITGSGAFTSRQGAITLPLDLLSRHSIRDQDVFSHGPAAAGLRDAIFDTAVRASDHLITARTMLSNIRAGRDAGHEYEHQHEEGHDHSPSPTSNQSRTPPKNNEVDSTPGAVGILISGAIPTQLWLERLEKSDFDIFNGKALRGGDWRIPIRTWWAMKRGLF